MRRLLLFSAIAFFCGVASAAEELPLSDATLLYCKPGQYSEGLVNAVPESVGAAVLFRPKQKVVLPGNGAVTAELTLLEGARRSDNFIFMYRSGQEKIIVNAAGKPSELTLNQKVTITFPVRPGNDLEIPEYRLYFNQRSTAGQPVKFQLHRLGVTRAEEAEKYITSLPLEKRERIFPKTLLYPRIQSKYSLIQNYLDSYCRIIFTDRPLFFNRALAGNDTWEYNKLNVSGSLISQYRTALEFTDGLGLLFGSPTAYNRTVRALDYLNNSDLKGVLWPEVSTQIPTSKDRVLLPEHEKQFFDIIDRLLASPAVSKPGGKLVLSSYQGENLPPEAWKKHIAKLRERYGDSVLATVEMRGTCYRLALQYRLHGQRIPASEIERAKNQVRSYLDVADGVNFSGSNHIIDAGDKSGLPAQRFFDEAYSNIIVPLLVSVINEPPYRGRKILGLSAHKVYFYRLRLMHSVDEQGTGGLRRSLETALAANPDYIVMPEWNEINENTHLEPTVSDSRTNIRVVNAMTGRETPEKNRELPNFILNFRQDNEIGAPLPVELLGLPDSAEPNRKYQVRLKLLDPAGRSVYEFPETSFDQGQMRAQSFMVPTLPFAGYRYLTPELTISENGLTRTVTAGLPHVRFSLSPNLNLKYVKIPLRDLPDPARINVAWRQDSDRITAAGTVRLSVPVNTVELLADDIPLAACDPRQEYRPPAGQLALRFYRLTPNLIASKRGNDRYRITAVSGELTGRKTHQIALSGMAAPHQEGNTLEGVFGGGAFSREIWFYASPDAVLEIECGGQTVRTGVAELLKNGIFRKTLEYGVAWGLEVVRELPEVPFPLEQNEVDFDLQCTVADREHPVYSLRVVTMDGGVYRSLPFHPEKSVATVQSVPVYEPLERVRQEAAVPSALTRRIQYRFQPGAGDILLAEPANREHHALGGGYTYYLHSHLKNEGSVQYTAPEWGTSNGKPVLKFSGEQYLMIPPPAFSRGAFSIEMDFRLDDMGEQVLINTLTGVFQLKIADGILSGYLKTNHGNHPFATAEALKPGQECRLLLSYDLALFTVCVDGRELGRWPASGIFAESPLLMISMRGSLSGLAISNFPQSK
jgi:hypothetical protein